MILGSRSVRRTCTYRHGLTVCETDPILSGRAVKPPYDELIAAARHLQGKRQTRSRRLGTADAILIEAGAAGPGQRIPLQIEVLVVS